MGRRADGACLGPVEAAGQRGLEAVAAFALVGSRDRCPGWFTAVGCSAEDRAMNWVDGAVFWVALIGAALVEMILVRRRER